MKDMLIAAGFADIQIAVKENAAEFISGWMPGSGAEKVITSAYVTARKPLSSWGFRDDVRTGTQLAAKELAPSGPAAKANVSSCGPSDCGPGA